MVYVVILRVRGSIIVYRINDVVEFFKDEDRSSVVI